MQTLAQEYAYGFSNLQSEKPRMMEKILNEGMLQGARAQLKHLVESELEQLGALLSQPSVQPWWGDPSPTELRAWLVDAPDTVTWGIHVDGELAGAASTFDAAWPPGSTIGMMIFLGEPWQNRGLGPEVLSLIVAYHIARGVHRFSVDPVVDNCRAIRAYQCCGFKPVGVLRQFDQNKTGGWRDCLLMDLLADEFIDRSGG